MCRTIKAPFLDKSLVPLGFDAGGGVQCWCGCVMEVAGSYIDDVNHVYDFYVEGPVSACQCRRHKKEKGEGSLQRAQGVRASSLPTISLVLFWNQ